MAAAKLPATGRGGIRLLWEGSVPPRRLAPLLLLLLTLALLAPASARGANPETTPMSSEAALTAGAVLAGDDPSGGGWYNPASLGGILRSSVQLGASAYGVGVSEVHQALVTVLPWGTVEQTARDTHYVSVPSVLSLSYKLDDGLGVAIGVWTPAHNFYTASIWTSSSGPYPGYPGVGASYESTYGLSYRWDDTWAGAAIGWQAHPRLRLGASLQGAYSSSSSVVDLDTGLQTTSSNPLEQGAHLNVSIRTDQSFLATRALVGLQWDLTSEVRLALTLRSPVLRLVAWGQASRVTSVAALLPGFAPQQGQLIEQAVAPSGASIIDVGRISIGGAWTRGPWSLRLDGEWGPALERAIASERASWNVRGGFLYQWDRDLRFGVGLFRDGARTRASDGSLSVDTYGLGGGIDFRPAKVVAALGGGESWDLLTGIAVRASWGFGQGPGMTIVPFAYSTSVVPIFPGQGDQPFQEVPARAFEGSIHFFTALGF
jgi:long-subunit fatty acid transport protein